MRFGSPDQLEELRMAESNQEENAPPWTNLTEPTLGQCLSTSRSNSFLGVEGCTARRGDIHKNEVAQLAVPRAECGSLRVRLFRLKKNLHNIDKEPCEHQVECQAEAGIGGSYSAKSIV